MADVSLCARPACDSMPSSDISCPKCADAPDGHLQSEHTRVRYCSRECLQQHAADHEPECRMRVCGPIIALFLKMLFLVLRLAMRDKDLERSQLKANGTLIIFWRDHDRETSGGQASPMAITPEALKTKVLALGDDASKADLALLSYNQCIRFMELFSLVLAFLIEGMPFQIDEVEVHAKEIQRIRFCNDNKTLQKAAPSHEMLRITTKGSPGAGETEEPPPMEEGRGMALNPTVAQYGGDQAGARDDEYLESHAVEYSDVEYSSFGTRYRNFHNQFHFGFNAGDVYSKLLRMEATIRTINNTLFKEVTEWCDAPANLWELHDFDSVMWQALARVYGALKELDARWEEVKGSDHEVEVMEGVVRDCWDEGHDKILEAFERQTEKLAMRRHHFDDSA